MTHCPPRFYSVSLIGKRASGRRAFPARIGSLLRPRSRRRRSCQRPEPRDRWRRSVPSIGLRIDTRESPILISACMIVLSGFRWHSTSVAPNAAFKNLEFDISGVGHTQVRCHRAIRTMSGFHGGIQSDLHGPYPRSSSPSRVGPPAAMFLSSAHSRFAADRVMKVHKVVNWAVL